MRLAHRVAAACLAPVALVGTATFYTIEKTSHFVVDSAAKELQMRAWALRDSIQITVDDYIGQWRNFARSPATMVLVEEQLKLHESIKNFNEHVEKTDALWLAGSEEVNPLIDRLRTNELSEELDVRTRLYLDDEGHNVFPEAFLTDDRGANIALTNRTSDYWQADETWWQKAWENGLHVGNVEFDESAGVTVIPISLRLDSADGRRLGVLKFVLNVSKIIEMIDHYSAMSFENYAVRAILLTETGQLVHDTGHEWKNNEALLPLFELDWKTIQKTGAKVITNDKNEEVLTAIESWPVSEEGWTLPWVIALERPTQAALGDAIVVRHRVTAATGAAVFFALVFTATLSLKTVRRVKRVSEAAEALGGGDLRTRIDEKGNDELANLARSFNTMADELLTAEIQQSVSQQRLQSRNMTLELEVEERQRLEIELVHAQKLESIGQLAAGIAHEINTPTQYVGDNVRFLQESLESLLKVIDQYEKFLAPGGDGLQWQERVKIMEDLEKELDVEFLREETPQAIKQSLEGLTRVRSIVSAMKDFSHPGSEEKQPANLNKAIESTLTVSRNHWKYVADVEFDLDESLPDVPCHLAEFNQVILNLVVNAADAIKEHASGSNENKGVIKISTRSDGKHAEIRVEDTGGGVPDDIAGKIFDPFFTTKDVGTGTGQGLAISRSVIVQKHAGTLTFESRPGVGTTFIISLPLEADVPQKIEEGVVA